MMDFGRKERLIFLNGNRLGWLKVAFLLAIWFGVLYAFPNLFP